MTEVNPPAFLQNAGSTHTAEIAREPFNALIGPRLTTGSQKSRGGVSPALGATLNTTQNGTPNMSVLINAGHVLVPGSEGASQATYSCYNDGQVNRTVTASDPSLPRIDLVIARVRDSFYSGATNAWALEIVTGTPAGSPAVPTLPNNSLALYQIAVAAGATSIVNANLTDVRPWLTAIGGIVPVRSQTERDALSGPWDGLGVYRQDTNGMQFYNGSTWDDFLSEPALRPIRITKGSDEPKTNNTTMADDAALFTGTLPANSIWFVQGWIAYTAPGTASVGGIKIAFSAPSGATFRWVPNIKTDTEGANQVAPIWKAECDTTAIIPAGGGGNLAFDPVGELTIGATPGPLKFRWAQNTSNGTSTIVKGISRLYLQRVG